MNTKVVTDAAEIRRAINREARQERTNRESERKHFEKAQTKPLVGLDFGLWQYGAAALRLSDGEIVAVMPYALFTNAESHSKLRHYLTKAAELIDAELVYGVCVGGKKKVKLEDGSIKVKQNKKQFYFAERVPAGSESYEINKFEDLTKNKAEFSVSLKNSLGNDVVINNDDTLFMKDGLVVDELESDWAVECVEQSLGFVTKKTDGGSTGISNNPAWFVLPFSRLKGCTDLAGFEENINKAFEGSDWFGQLESGFLVRFRRNNTVHKAFMSVQIRRDEKIGLKFFEYKGRIDKNVSEAFKARHIYKNQNWRGTKKAAKKKAAARNLSIGLESE